MLNKRISDFFDDYEFELELPASGNFDSAKIKEMAMQKINTTGKPAAVCRKSVRVALIAAVIACFMSVTAFAAAYFGVDYRMTEEDERQVYQIQYGNRTHDLSYNATMVMNFASQPEGNLYAFRTTWTPSEPTGPKTLSLYRWAVYEAMNRLGMQHMKANEQNPQTQDAIAQVLKEMGVTAEEAESWYTFCDTDDDWDIPYQIELLNTTDLYNRDFLVGYDGAAVQIAKDETEGDWQELWINIDQTVLDWAEGQESPILNSNHVLRYNLKEGYLIKISGTLDFETLHKMAENTEVLKTELITEYDKERWSFGCILSLGRG